jgi:hypothetical protein
VPKAASRSALLKHLMAGVELPTPRGSKPTMSKRCRMSSGSSRERYAASCTPDAPGPPGLTISEPIRRNWCWLRTRISATSNVLPSFLLLQSCGTDTEPQS